MVHAVPITYRKGPEMIFNLVLVVPVLALVVYALAALAAPRSWLDRPLYTPPTPGGRHRTTSVRTPYRPRPWDEMVTGEQEAVPNRKKRKLAPRVFDPLDHRIPLAEVEMWAASWGDPLPPIVPFPPVPPVPAPSDVMPISAPPAPSASDTGELVAIA